MDSRILKERVTQRFEELRKQAEASWQKLWSGERPVILVGAATCGQAAGALEVLQAIKDELGNLELEAMLIEVGCMGHCYAEPLVTIKKPGWPPILYGYIDEDKGRRLVQDFLVNDDPCLEFALGALEENELLPSFFELPRFRHEKLVLLENCGRINPEEVEHYLACGGYAGLARALMTSPAEVIAEVKRSGLRGRGGAGFPTGQKWDICRHSAGRPKYVICNADEGDPGAFMDRAILESDPHSVLEGLIIAGYAVGARQGYIYVRAEYPLAVKRMGVAIEQAREKGFLGHDILGSGFSFEVELFQGSGAFVCGEETALIASIEGRPGLPHHRPPYPATKGLFGKPTVINNVKTLASVSRILSRGADWFADIGTEGSKGTAVFALAGKILNTGLTEVPMGTTLREVVFDIGGGVPGGKKFKAVQIGGPSGGCLPEEALDLPIDFDSLTQAGAMMGSGGLVVLNEDDCMVDIARYFLEFTQRESCGKCTLCRLGTRQMLEILVDITQGKGREGDIELLEVLAEDVKSGSLCALGRTAPNPILTTLRYFRDEYEAHIQEKRCPALKCPALIAYYILPEKCERSCDACVGSCTVEAISTDERKIKVIDQEKCVKCGTCLEACPPEYNAVVKLSPPDLVPKKEQSSRGLK